MNHARLWRAGRQVRADFGVDELDVLLADPTNLVWFDLVDPSPEQLGRLTDELDLSVHAIEDAVAPAERPKAHRNGQRLFVQAYSAGLTGDPQAGESRL